MENFNLREYLSENKLFEAAMACPAATQNLELNTKNRDASIKADYIKYGPLNVDEPGDYWKELAEYWDTTLEAAKKSLCGNCVASDISPRMDECMPGKVSDDSGRLGYCWMHNLPLSSDTLPGIHSSILGEISEATQLPHKDFFAASNVVSQYSANSFQ
jgi:hypothetical protein